MSSSRARPRKRPSDQVPPRLQELLGPFSNPQALLTPVLVNTFAELGISVALWIQRDWWYPIHSAPSIESFEYDFGVAARRWAYNARAFDEVRRTRKPVLAEHAGFHDVFVPVYYGTRLAGVFVAGQFALRRPTSADVLERWFSLSGAQGRLSDAAFSSYLSVTLGTLTLDPGLLRAFERLMTCFAALVAGQGSLDVLAGDAETLRKKLALARYHERAWQAAHTMVDELAARGWATHAHATMNELGLEHVPEHVVVGLLLGRETVSDPVKDVLDRDAFQRACVDLARKLGRVASGRVGDHGVCFVVDHPSAGARARLGDIAARAAATARRFGFRLHCGISQGSSASTLPTRYRIALGAAERALSGGASVIFGDASPERSTERLRQLRTELARSIEDRVGVISPRFERYMQAVLVHSAYRLEPARAHLEAGLERLAEPLLGGGLIDPKSFDELCTATENAARDVRTIAELVAAYRRLVTQIEAAIRSPTGARKDRGIQRALTFVQEHIGEPITLPEVARVAGFAPEYFSRTFSKSEGVPFKTYLQNLRVDRAKIMLATTSLNVEQIQRLSGLRNRSYFHRLFRRRVGMTPAEFRARYLGDERP